MNQKRRNQLEIILNRLEDVQSDVIKIRDEEEHCRDNLDALDGLADAVSSIVSAIAE